MSLATRCPSCGTVFRVVRDQLRVSEGWVRCGRCDAVFDASQQLLDIDRGVPVQWQADDEPAPTSTVPPAATAPTAAPSQWPELEADDSLPPPEMLLRRPAQALQQPIEHDPPPPPTPPQPLPDADPANLSSGAPTFVPPLELPPIPPAAPEPPSIADDNIEQGPVLLDPEAGAAAPIEAPAEPRFDLPPIAVAPVIVSPVVTAPIIDGPPSEPLAAPATAIEAGSLEIGNWAAERAVASDGLKVEIAGEPEFLRQAERAAAWQHPMARGSMWLAALALLALALAQAALLKRDLLAAQHPDWAPVLQALCQPFGCSVAPPRRIDQLVIESSTLRRLDAESTDEHQRYHFGVTLRNRADTLLLLPALELSLTDAQGHLATRRVVKLAELGARGDSISAGAEVPLAGLLDTGDRRVEGYTVELFYP